MDARSKQSLHARAITNQITGSQIHMHANSHFPCADSRMMFILDESKYSRCNSWLWKDVSAYGTSFIFNLLNGTCYAVLPWGRMDKFSAHQKVTNETYPAMINWNYCQLTCATEIVKRSVKHQLCCNNYRLVCECEKTCQASLHCKKSSISKHKHQETLRQRRQPWGHHPIPHNKIKWSPISRQPRLAIMKSHSARLAQWNQRMWNQNKGTKKIEAIKCRLDGVKSQDGL